MATSRWTLVDVSAVTNRHSRNARLGAGDIICVSSTGSVHSRTLADIALQIHPTLTP